MCDGSHPNRGDTKTQASSQQFEMQLSSKQPIIFECSEVILSFPVGSCHRLGALHEGPYSILLRMRQKSSGKRFVWTIHPPKCEVENCKAYGQGRRNHLSSELLPCPLVCGGGRSHLTRYNVKCQ